MNTVKRIIEMTAAERKAEALELLKIEESSNAHGRLDALTRYQVNGGYGAGVTGFTYKLDECLKLFGQTRLHIKQAQTGDGRWRWGVVLWGVPPNPTLRAWSGTLPLALLEVWWKMQPDDEPENLEIG